MSTLGNLAIVSPLLLVAAAGLWIAARLAARRPAPARVARPVLAPADHAAVLARYGVHPAGSALPSATVTRIAADRPVRDDVVTAA